MISFVREVIQAGSLEDRLYFVGYKGMCLSRPLRRLFAGSGWHRAWLCGYMGLYEEGGKPVGVCDREWHQYRARDTTVSDAGKVLLAVLRPHSY
jgi:hypothetical protein